MEINFDTVKKVITEAGIQGDLAALTADTTFESVGVDSLDTFTILLSIEEAFGVTIPEEKAEELDTISKLISFLNDA